MDKQLQTMIDNMPEKTGKSLEAWKKILDEKKFSKHSEALNFLKSEHGVSHGFANTIVHLSKESTSSYVDLVDEQYKGKEELRPLYDQIKRATLEFGNDVEIAPKKSYVSLRRNKQFAIIQPSTKSRLDIGLNLKGHKAEGILEDSGSWNAMCTHRIRLESADDLNPQVFNWLKKAYQEN